MNNIEVAARIRVKRNLRKVLAAIAFISIMWISDQFLQARELRSLTNEIVKSEEILHQVIQNKSTILDHSSNDPSYTIQAVEQGFKRNAELQRPLLRDCALRIAEQDYLPWHFQIRRARESYLSHNLAWDAHLKNDLSPDGNIEGNSDQHEQISNTWFDVKVRLPSAVPTIFSNDLHEQIIQLISE